MSITEAGNLSSSYESQRKNYSSTTTTTTTGSNSISEIEEEDNSSDLFEIDNGHHDDQIRMDTIKEDGVFSVDIHNGDDGNAVYVALGKGDSSMDALSWTLTQVVGSSSTVYLVHVFPDVLLIPSPLGKLPKSKVSSEQVESFMAQERGKRRELLNKYLSLCSAYKVKVDTILIESDMISKALLDLIPILNIPKLIVGTNKSSLRKLRSRKGNGIADQLLQSAPDSCEVRIICEGKEVIVDKISGSPSPSSYDQNNNFKSVKQEKETSYSSSSSSCSCFS